MKLKTMTIILSALTIAVSQSANAEQAKTKVNARNMFVEQLNKPKEEINAGVTYWLELERNKKKSRVSNKTTFASGDHVKVHIKSNFDGYAYILMMQGSNGDKAVLFPDKENAKSNQIKAGQEISIPNGENALSFDDTPGTETLRIIVSRKPIDAEKELGTSAPQQVTIGAVQTAQSDKVPDGTVVCIVLPHNNAPKISTRNMFVESTKSKPSEQGTTTVINTDPNKRLSIDVALLHEKAAATN